MTLSGIQDRPKLPTSHCGLRFVAMALSVFGVFAAPATGEPIVETLSPNIYTVFAGEQFTIGGSVLFPNAATYAYGAAPQADPPNQDEYLFGLNPTSPHLEITAGTVELSLDFPGGSGGPLPAYFEDIFGQGGWLGPATFQGPGTTPVTDWRTFIVPAGTPPGVYDYSYGITFSENGNAALEGIAFAPNLQVDVESTPAATPEPTPLALVALGLAILATYGRTCSMKAPGISSGINTKRS